MTTDTIPIRVGERPMSPARKFVGRLCEALGNVYTDCADCEGLDAQGG